MNIQEFWESNSGSQINQILTQAVSNWSAQAEGELLKIVEATTLQGGILDVTRNENNEAAQLLYVHIARKLRKANHQTLPVQMLLKIWDQFGEYQRVTKKRIHRGIIGFGLLEEEHRKGNSISALRWALLTQAEDLLGSHETGDIRGALSRIFGITGIRWDEIKELVYSQRLKADQEGWEKPFGFSEFFLLTLIQKSRIGLSILTEGPSGTEFHLSKPFLAALLEFADHQVCSQSNPTGLTTKQKGDRFEDIAFYLCSLLPGCIPRRNLFDQQQAYESDVVVQNLASTPNVVSDFLGRHFLVECKNWSSRKVPVADVGYFLFRIRLTHTKFGILFAANGVTGDDDVAAERGVIAANALIRRAYHEDGITCVALRRSDLEMLVYEEMTFWSLLLSKMNEFRFGR